MVALWRDISLPTSFDKFHNRRARDQFGTYKFLVHTRVSDDLIQQMIEKGEEALSEDGYLLLPQLKENKPDLAPGIECFIKERWIEQLYQICPDSTNLLYFDEVRQALVKDARWLERLRVHPSNPICDMTHSQQEQVARKR